jgi:hypothetical protein
MKSFKKTTLLGILSIIFFGCDDKPVNNNNTSVILKTQFELFNKEIEYNKYLKFIGDDSILINQVSMLVSDPTITTSGSPVFNNSIFYVKNTNPLIVLSGIDISKTTIASIDFLVGLNKTNNKIDPTDNEANAVLKTAGQDGMYWPGWTSYRFFVLECKIKKPDNSITNITYHVGGDNYLIKKNLNLTSISFTSGKENIVPLRIHIDKIFSNPQGAFLNYHTENTTHSEVNQDAITKKLVTNIGSAITL